MDEPEEVIVKAAKMKIERDSELSFRLQEHKMGGQAPLDPSKK